jgi:hypothetical protein
MSDVKVNASGVASSINLALCIAPVEPSSDSAITQWIRDVILITRLSTSIMGDDDQGTVGQMLIATAVGSTENYFRTLLADMADTCPYTGANVAQQVIPFAAFHTFRDSKVGFGLVEGSLFSSKGVIASELKRFTKYKIADGSDLAKAVASFNAVCSIRHAAVHWSGRFDTRSHSALHEDVLRRGQHGLALDLKIVQDSLAACDFLVRLANQTLFDLTLQRWLDGGYLGPDNDARTNADRSRAVARIFAEDRLKPAVARHVRRVVADE